MELWELHKVCMVLQQLSPRQSARPTYFASTRESICHCVPRASLQGSLRTVLTTLLPFLGFFVFIANISEEADLSKVMQLGRDTLC